MFNCTGYAMTAIEVPASSGRGPARFRHTRQAARSPRLVVLVTCGTVLLPNLVLAQTLADIAGGEECTTAGTEGISAQLTRFHACQFPETVTRLADQPNITLVSDRTYDLVANETRAALVSAASTTPLRISVAYRPVSEQFVLNKTPSCATFEKPGSGVHETAKAVDVQNWQDAAPALLAAGCMQTQMQTLPFHFECPGPNMKSNAVLVFQKLWNLNRPEDQIAEDGDYGPQTESRLAMTPASGFEKEQCPDISGMTRDAGTDAAVRGDAGDLEDGGRIADAAVEADAGLPPFDDKGCECAVSARTPSLALIFATLALLRTRRKSVA